MYVFNNFILLKEVPLNDIFELHNFLSMMNDDKETMGLWGNFQYNKLVNWKKS